jgi:hypothetical protein
VDFSHGFELGDDRPCSGVAASANRGCIAALEGLAFRRTGVVWYAPRPEIGGDLLSLELR